MAGGIFVFPESNVLRFIDTTNYLTSPQTMYNRLQYHEKWQLDDEINLYYQKFSNEDPILIQFTTNWVIGNIVVRMYDTNNIEVITDLTLQIAHSYSDGSGLVTYNVLCNTANIPIGKYFFKAITVSPEIEFSSETIEIGSFDNYPYLEWRGSDNDGVYYTESTIFGLRVEAKIIEYEGSESSIYTGFNSQPEIERNIPLRFIDFKISGLPRFFKSKLSVIMAHNQIFINKIEYIRKSDVKTELIEGTNMYDFSTSLQEKYFEDYTILQELTGIGTNFQNYVDFDDVDYTDFEDSNYTGLL